MDSKPLETPPPSHYELKISQNAYLTSKLGIETQTMFSLIDNLEFCQL